MQRRQGCWTTARTPSAFFEELLVSGSGQDGHLGSSDSDGEAEWAHGVGEGRAPRLSALPVDGGVLINPIRISDLEIARNNLADGEGQRNLVAEA